VLGGLVVATGSVLPWVSATGPVSFTSSGWQLGANGAVTWVGPVLALLAALTVGVAVTRLRHPKLRRLFVGVTLLSAILVALVLGASYGSLHDSVNQIDAASRLEHGAIGTGFWLLAGGGVATLVSSLVTGAQHRWRGVRSR
jgi:hypothetical protein